MVRLPLGMKKQKRKHFPAVFLHPNGAISPDWEILEIAQFCVFEFSLNILSNLMFNLQNVF